MLKLCLRPGDRLFYEPVPGKPARELARDDIPRTKEHTRMLKVKGKHVGVITRYPPPGGQTGEKNQEIWISLSCPAWVVLAPEGTPEEKEMER